MSRRIRSHLRSNIVGYVCLFWLMTGTAYAPVIANSNGEVAGNTSSGHQPPAGDHANVIAGSISTADLAPDSVTGAKVSEGTLDPDVLQRRITGACPARQAIRTV